MARLKGNGSEKPLLLMAHLDVVGTTDQKWSTPPHEVTARDGFLYGRGVMDDLAMAMAIANIETLIQLKAGGTRVNALPAEAHVNVNCRILPDETPEQVRDRLAQIVHDPKIEVTMLEPFGPGGASPVDGVVPATVRDLMREEYPGVLVSPSLQSSATDSRYLRRHGVAADGGHGVQR